MHLLLLKGTLRAIFPRGDRLMVFDLNLFKPKYRTTWVPDRA
jgi:hypothetical protein